MVRRSQIVAVWLVCGLYGAYLLTNGFAAVQFLARWGNPAFLTSMHGEVVRVTQVRPNSPAADLLRRGDQVLALAGKGVTLGFNPREAFEGHPPGETFSMTLRREGRVVRLSLQTVGYGLSFATFSVLGLISVGFVFLIVGATVLALKPGDHKALLLALAFALFSGHIAGPPMWPHSQGLLWLCCACETVSIFFWPVLLHLFLVFPEPSPALKRFPSLARWIYLPALGFWPLTAIAAFLGLRDRIDFMVFVEGVPSFRLLYTGLALLYTASALVFLVLNYRQASISSRRKLRVVVAGSLVGFTPLLAVLVIEALVADISEIGLVPARLLVLSLFLATPLVPFAFAYAIVRHQVIPVRVILRRGIRYMLVSRGFYLVEGLAMVLAVAFVLSGSRAAFLDRIGGRADSVAAVLVAGGVFGLLRLLNLRVIPRIEKRFFRDAYDSTRIVSEIGEAARSLLGIDDLFALAASQVDAALHPESIAIFVPAEGGLGFRRQYPSGEGADTGQPDPRLLEVIQRSLGAVESDAGGISLPIVAESELLGILSLGPRRADLPYSGEDRRFLQAVAWQLAFAVENARLVERKAEEGRMRREIALASEVQKRLFPEQLPRSRSLDLAGVCLPAQGVGGDYYDFLDLGNGLIGIAVADVAGKGISAALLMSVVQASLRSQAGGASPAHVVASMNQLLYRSASRNRFATLFYAEYDEASGTLTYVNAGHNPPLVLRSTATASVSAARGRAAQLAGSDVGGGVSVSTLLEAPTYSLLSTGGLVIGAFSGTTYDQAITSLQQGDVLVAYTDGVTEAFDTNGIEFGEERLREAVTAAAGLPASHIVDAVVDAVRAHSRGAPQHDDLTLVVAKVH